MQMNELYELSSHTGTANMPRLNPSELAFLTADDLATIRDSEASFVGGDEELYTSNIGYGDVGRGANIGYGDVGWGANIGYGDVGWGANIGYGDVGRGANIGYGMWGGVPTLGTGMWGRVPTLGTGM